MNVVEPGYVPLKVRGNRMGQKKQTRPFVITGFILLAVAFLFKWRFIYSEPVGDQLLGSVGVPTWSNGNSGLHYTGIVFPSFCCL